MVLNISRFIKTIVYFSIPFILLIFALVYIDPYNILRKEENTQLTVLKDISSKVNYPLFGLQKYFNDPTDIIVLGDSRSGNLSEELFKKEVNKKSTNLAYGGGSLNEIIKTFWIVSKINKLNEVYIGINFNLYNALNNKDRVSDANRIRNSLSSYLLSKYTIKSTFLILKSYLTDKKISIEKPTMSRDEFWQYQLNISGLYFFENYKYPVNYFRELLKISEYCRKNKIKLTLFIPPTHTELQEKIKEYKLEKEYKKFMDDLVSLGNPIYDFNFSNVMTINKENFSDPFHFNHSFSKIIIKIITNDGLNTQDYRGICKLIKQ